MEQAKERFVKVSVPASLHEELRVEAARREVSLQVVALERLSVGVAAFAAKPAAPAAVFVDEVGKRGAGEWDEAVKRIAAAKRASAAKRVPVEVPAPAGVTVPAEQVRFAPAVETPAAVVPAEQSAPRAYPKVAADVKVPERAVRDFSKAAQTGRAREGGKPAASVRVKRTEVPGAFSKSAQASGKHVVPDAVREAAKRVELPTRTDWLDELESPLRVPPTPEEIAEAAPAAAAVRARRTPSGRKKRG